MNDNKRKLYDALSNDYDMGTYEQFRKDLEDKDKRRKLYDATSDAYDFGDYDQFEAQLGYGQSQSAPSAEEINSGSAGPVMPKPAMENRNWEVQMGNGHSRATVEKPEPVDVPIPQRPEGQEPSDDGTAAPSGDVRSYLENANRQQVANLSRDINSRLDEAQTKSRDIYMKEQEDARKGGFLSTLAHAIAASGHNPEGRSGGMSDAQQRTLQGANSELQSEISKLEAAKKAMSNAEEIIAEADKSVQEGEFPGFFKGIARGFGDKLFDVNTWDMGVSDTKNSIELLKALRKYDEGKPLSESEQMLLDAKSVELATNAYFGSYIGRGYKAGAVTAQSLPFMLEMAVNPASTLGESTQSMLARYALSRFAKKGATRAAQKFATKAAGAAGRALGDIAGSAVMAGTSGAVRVAGDAIDRHVGDIETDMDGQGQTVFAGHDPESLGKSIAKAFTSTAIENHSEMLGEYFAPALGIVSKLGRKGMEKFGLKKVVDFVDDVSATDAAKLIADFQKRTKWNGTIGEYAEEVAGNIENAILVGDNTLDASDDTGVFNLDQNIDTFLGVALMGGVFSAVRTAMWRTPKYRARMEMEKARDEARTKYGSEAWQEIEDRMAEAGDDGMSAVLSTVIAGENSPEKAKALLDYAKSIKKYEGMLAGDEKRREIASPEATDLETSYENGYTLSTPQEVHDAKLMFEYQEAMLQKALGTSDIDIDTIMLGNEMGTLTDGQKSVAMDYLNAKATFDGVIDRVRDDLDSRISSVENAIDASTNRDTGMLQPASLVDDRPVHIISGIVRLTPDGTMVDTRNSENFIIVRDDRTGRMETISPSDINRLENEIDPAMEKQTARQQIQDVYGSREADSIDGVLAFNPGDTYTLTNEQGQSFPVQIVANEQGATDNGDGTVNVILNNDIDTQTGQPRITQMPKEQIQEMAEATNLSRLQQYEQQKLARAAEQAETDATGRTPENPFRINDRITLSDAETGNVENGVVGSELTDDGKYEVVVEKQDGSQSILYLSPSELEQLGAKLEQPEAVEERNAPVLEQNQPVLEQKTEKTEQDSAMSRIPSDRDGVPQFEQAQPSDTWEALLELNSGNAVEAEDTARQMYENASKNLDKAQKTKPKSGTSVMEIQRNKAERNGQIDELRKSVDFWGKVLSFPEAVRKSASAAAEAEVRQKEDAKREAVRQAKENLAKGRKLMQQKGTYYKDDAKLGDYLDFHDYALRMIANGRVKFVWKNDADNNSIKGLGGHLGLEDSESERKALFSLLANQDKGGLRPDDAAEQLSEEYNSSLGAEVISSSEALDVILDIIRTYGGKTRDMMNAAIDAHAMAGMDERGHDEDNKSSEDKDNSKIAEGQESIPADAPLSNEMNEFGVPFIESSDGTTVFGVLTDDSGLSPAPIKLSLGENAADKNGTNHGYGLLHIEAGHGDQIRAAGYSSIKDFVEDVARNYDTIREGGIVANNQTYLLELSDEHNNTLFIQLSRDGSYWNINSAGIFKKKYSRRKPEVFTRPALKTETDTDSGRVDSSRSNGVTAPAGNSHQTSEGKDTNISEESNTGSGKSVTEQITEQREVVNTEPTEAQKEAGNYRMGHVKIDGMDVTIENPKGSIRRGTDADGKKWESEMHYDYGYIRGTKAVDNDHIDIFLSDNPETGNVFVVDQVNPKTGEFDESKVMYGFSSEQEARDAYLSNYEKGWKGLGKITEVTREEFKKWIESSTRKTKPFSEYASVKTAEAQKEKPVQGLEGYSRDEIKGIVTDHINDVMRDYDIDAEIIGMDIHGSRNRHDARPDSDLDVVVEYSGDIREDDMFNALNGEEDALSIEGIKVDINPIRKEETGDLQDYMKQSEEYDREKSSADNQGNPVNEDSTPAGRAVKEEEKPAEVSAPAETETPKNEGAFGLVSDDRMAELKERLRKKLSGQLNMGIDPEILAIGMELAVGHIDRGIKTFADFSKKMIEDLGDVIRPYLKAFYNGARDLPEVIESGLSAEMTPYDEVRRFNVATIGENGEEKKPTILETAEQVSNELTVQRNADEVEVVVSETENTTNDVYSIAPAQYTTKRGKVLDMFLVKPNDELGTSEQRAANARVREMKGWWDKKAGGFMLRSEEDARQFVEQTFRNPIGTTASANEVQAAKTSLMSDTGSSRDEQEVNAAVGKTFKSKKGLILYVDRIDDGRVFYEITDIDGTTERYDTSIPAMADALQRWEEVTVTDNNNNNETDRTAAEQAAENKQPKNSTKKKKSVSSHTEVADLFGSININESDNENDTAEPRSNEAEGGRNRTVGDVSTDGDGVLESESTGATDGGEIATPGAEYSGLADGEPSVLPTIGGRGGRTQRNNVGSAEQPDGSGRGYSVSTGDAANGRNATGETPSGSRQTKRDSGRRIDDGSKKTANERNNPKNTRNYLYGKDAEEIDNMSEKQRLATNVEALETLVQVLREKRDATAEERALMGKFRGWGGIDLTRFYSQRQLLSSNAHPSQYNPETGRYEAVADNYQRLGKVLNELDPDEKRGIYKDIRHASLTSYYTPLPIARAMNDYLVQAGYKGGGNLLDPSMGTGIFEGTLPKDVQQHTNIYGVELDWLTAQLAKQLYPDAHVENNGFEKAELTAGAYDIVESNIPFGDIAVDDASWRRDSSPVRKAAMGRIHNYFAVKMMEMAKAGGLVTIMTSNAIMDTKGNAIIRKELLRQGEFLGAIRLPNNVFKGAGTAVVTDVIFMRKYRNEEDSAMTNARPSYKERVEQFNSSATMRATNKDMDVPLNGYFAANPKMMIGDVVAGGQYREDEFGLTSKEDANAIAKKMTSLVKKQIVGDRAGSLYDTTKPEREVQQAIRETYIGDGNYNSAGNIVEQNGKYGVLNVIGRDGALMFEENPELKKNADRIKLYIPVRTAFKKLTAAQINRESEAIIKKYREELNDTYNAFVKKFGRLNDKANNFIEADIDSYQIRGLEDIDSDTGKVKKLADIFTKNTIKPTIDMESANNPSSAIATCLAGYGEIRPAFMEKVLGENWRERCHGTLYRLPNSESYVVADDYLSGDVKTKLEEARAAAALDETYQENVDALEKVQPRDLMIGDINIRMGARWVSDKTYTDFLREMFGMPDWGSKKSQVRYVPEADEFLVEVDTRELGGEADRWATNHKTAKEVFEAAMKDKTLQVWNHHIDGSVTLNKEETQLANDKVQDLRETFETWVSSDPERGLQLASEYNDKFNRTVIRKWNGDFLDPVGLQGITLRAHQKAAVWMLLNNRGGIVDHIVGAGKTLVMQSAIMEMRRMGIAKKPMILALKATCGQIAKEFSQAYPSARILAPTEKDFSEKNRKKLLAKIASNDYDCVIISHEQYTQLPHTQEVETQTINEQLEQLDAAIMLMRGADDKSQLTKRQLKGLEKRKANLETKMQKMLDRKVDREFCFENLGVDYLFVDECQQFKGLPYATTYNQVAGLGDPQGSQRAVALLNGVRYLQRLHQGDRGTVFLSGTTITNTLVEVYNLLNYLRPNMMQKLGYTTFDAWAAQYAVKSADLEYGVTNELKTKTRFRSFQNVSELGKLYAEIADVRNDMNLELPKPKPNSHLVKVPATPLQEEINREVAAMVQQKNGDYFGITSVDDRKAPWSLHASRISEMSAIDPRLIFPDAEDEGGGKVPVVCESVAKLYKQFDEDKGTQLIFCDKGIPDSKKGYDVYTDIINRLVNEYGIPRSEIVDIHTANTEEKRKALFKKVNDGTVRILIGGTKNMGTGVNVQERLIAEHHLDMPWTPADREQREGRAVRQGNWLAKEKNGNKVELFYYATEGSLDMYKYQLQEIKGKMFAQFKTNTIDADASREFDEGASDAEGSIDPAEMVAILSGNPVIFEKSKQDKLVKKLRRQEAAERSDYVRRKKNYEQAEKDKQNMEELLRKNRKDVAELTAAGFVKDEGGTYPNVFQITTDMWGYAGRSFDKAKDAGKYIHDALKEGKDVRIKGYNVTAKVEADPNADGDLFARQLVIESIGRGTDYGEHQIRYSVKLSDDDTAAGMAFRNLLERIIKNGEVYQRKLDEANHKLQGADKLGEYKFSKQEQLDEAIARKQELDAEYQLLSDDKPESESGENEDNNRYRIREAERNATDAESIANAAKETGKKLGTKMRIVENVEELTDKDERKQKRMRRAKGWYDTATGEVVVVVPNADNVGDVVATVLHETVGHKGLRELVGDDRFDDFLDKVYAAATKATRLEIVGLARRNHWDFRLATEEYIAGLAEKGFSGRENRTLFGKIKDFFLDMLSRAKIALGFNIGDNELRYMLWRTYQMRTSRGILAKANDMAVQQELKVGNFREDNSSPVSFLKQMQDNAETLAPRQLTKEIWDNEIKGKVFSTPIGVVKLGENQYEKNIKKGRELEFGMLIPTIERPDAIFEEDAPEAGAERQTKYVFVKSFVENGVKKINYASVSVRKDGMEVVASSHYLRDKQMLNKIEKERMLWNRFASGSELSAQGGSTAQSNALSLDANLLKGVKKTNSDEEILSGEDSKLRFRTSGNGGSSNTARDIYEEKTRVIDRNGRKSDTANLMRRLKEAYVDSMQSLKYLQDAISEETGKPVEDFENAYLAENSMSSKNKAQTDIYLNRFFNPIKDAIRDLQKEGAEYGDIVRYLMAKHGLERNEVFSKRDAEKDGGVWDGSVRRDYSGLTELTRRDTDTVAPRIDEITSRAEDIVRKFEMDHDTDVLWEKINAATKDTLRTSYVTGMLTKDNYEMVRSMFRYYIPLRGWSENTASAVYDYLSDARPKTSSIVKAATGRTTISDDPIATIAYMGQSAIIQGNRNLMKQKLLNLALNHKTGLLTVSRQWEVLDPVTGMWTPRDPDIPADAAPEQVADIVADFEKDMKEAEKKGVARLSRGKLDTGKHLTAYEGQEHIIKVKRGGIDYSIYLNGNPRAAQAVNGMTNPDAVDSWLIRKARVIKNFMARMFTSQNPAFIISNLSRDVIFAGTAVYAKEDAKYAARYAKNITVALAKGQLIGLIHRFETDRLDNSKDLDRYFGEFIRNGGETGFTQLNTVDDFKRDIDRFSREMKQGQVMKVSTKVWNGIWDGIEYMNRCAEDATRFSVYMTSRQMGRSVERSISDAKEITVNFNRKGSGGFGARLMNFAYIFFNAAVQSLANAGKIMYEHPMKALAALGAFSAAGFMAPLLAQAIISAFGGDDDAYWDLPEWVRRNNFVFYIPWSENKFLIIPISQELRPFYAMGEIAMSVLMGKEEVLDGLKSAAGSFMDLLPIDFMGNGGNLAISLTPTVAQPFAQLVANTDYFGSPIYRRNDYNKLDPAWTKAYKGTSPMLVNASKWLNEVTGGDDVKRGWIDPINNPAVIEHLFESYLGGTGKTINRAAKTFSMIWNPDMRDIRNVPIASTFIQESDDERVAGNQLNREYFKLIDEFKETSHTVSGYKKKARMGSMEYADKLNEFMETPDFERYSKARGYANTISKLRQALKRAQESGEDVMVEENLQQILHDLKRQMVEELKEQ